MSLRPPKLGSVDRLSLYQGVDAETGSLLGQGVTEDPALEGVTVGIKFVGTEVADAFRQRAMADQLAEAKRLGELRKGLTRDQAPELWQIITPESTAASMTLIRDVLKEMVADVHGPGEVLEGAEAHGFVAGLSMAEKSRLVSRCLEAQGASRRQIFRAPAPRDPPAFGPADANPTGS